MRIRCVTGLIMLLVLSLASCREGRWWTFGLSAEDEEMLRLDLSLADSLMEESPDSSMSILRRDSALVCHAGMEYRMMYNLLRTQADDKLYVTHKSDSVIREAAEYFSVNGNARQQAQAWYLLGRVSYDLHHASTAMSAFRHVLSVKDESSVVCRYKSYSTSWIATLYEESDLYEKVLDYNRISYKYAKQSDRPSQAVFALRDIGRSYKYIDDTRQSIEYYKKAIIQAQKINDRKLCCMVAGELAIIYIENRMFNAAKKLLMQPIDNIYKEDLAAHYYTIARYYEAEEIADSAVFYYNKSLDYGDITFKRNTYLHLAEMCDRQDKVENARRYRKYASIYDDSLLIQNQEGAYDNIRNIEDNMKMEGHIEKLDNNKKIITSTFFFYVLISIVLMYVVFLLYKKSKQHSLQERKREKGIWLNKHKRDRETIELVQKEIDTLKKEMVWLNCQNAEQQDSDEIMTIEELKKTKIYLMFQNKMFIPTDDDFTLLEDTINKTYNNFTIRLKQKYPHVNKTERRLCCLLKIELHPKTICLFLKCNSSTLSMKRKSLYRKFFNAEGKPSDFDDFIQTF